MGRRFQFLSLYHVYMRSARDDKIGHGIIVTVLKILCLHDLPSLSPKVRFLARSGPPFVIRGIPIQ